MKNKQINYHNRIVSIPGVIGGKPVVEGTRIPVTLILERLEEDTDTKLLFEDYPQLTQGDIKACLWYAKELVQGEDSYLLKIPKREHTTPAYTDISLSLPKA